MIFFKPHFFKPEVHSIKIPPGASLHDVLHSLSVPAKHRPYLVASVNGVQIPSEKWREQRLDQSDTVEVQLIPMGGSDEKNPLAFIAQIALLASTGSMVARWGLVGTDAALANAALTVGGTLLINSVFPPPTVNRDTRRDPKESQNYTAQASRNQIDPYGPQISVFGKTLLTPKYAAAPYTLSVGDTQFLYMLFDLGYGKVEPTEIKFGENAFLSAYEEVEYKLHQEFVAGDTLDFFVKDVFTEDFSLAVLKDSPRIVTTTELSDEAIVNLTWPRGLTKYNDKGNRVVTGVGFRVEWKKTSDEEFKTLSLARGYNTSSPAVSAFVRSKAFAIASSTPVTRESKSRLLYYDISFHKTPIAGDTVLEAYTSFPIEAGVDKIVEQGRQKTYGITKTKTYPNSTRIDITLDAPLLNFTVVDQLKVQHNEAKTIPKGTTVLRVRSEEYAPVVGDFLYIGGVKHKIQSIEDEISHYYEDGGVFKLTLENPLDFDVDGVYAFGYDAHFTGAYLMGADCYLQSKDVEGIDMGLTRKTAEPFSLGVSVKFPEPGQYDLRVTRLTDDSNDDRTVNEFILTALQSLKNQTPVAPRSPRTYIELKVKTNEQLNGPIDDFNCIASRYLPVDDGQGNFSLQETSLPPWIIREILTGSVTGKPIDPSKIHEESFREFETWCKQLNDDGEYKFQCDFVFDWDTTVRDLIQQVAAVGRATVIQVDGKHRIVIDKEKEVRTQVFTSRNIAGYSSGRFLPDRPDYVRSTFVDRESGYTPQTGNVFDDGKTLENSSVFESQEHFGTTRWRQAWENTRWMMAQGVHRSKYHRFTVDIEGLVCLKGDRVGFQHELPRQGGISTRLETISQEVVNGQVETILGLDRDVVDGGFDEYSVLFRTNRGEVFVITGMEIAPEHGPNKIAMPDYPEGDPNPYADVNPGDLVVYGETDKTIVDCLVDAIDPIADLGFEVKLVSYAPEVLTADTGEIGRYNYSQSHSDLFGSPPLPVIHVRAHQNIEYKDRYPFISIWLTWKAATGGAYANQFEIYYQSGDEYESIVDGIPSPFEPRLVGITKETKFNFLDSKAIDQDVIFGKKHFFWIVAVSSQGSKLPLRASKMITITPEKDAQGPGVPKNLVADAVGGTLYLSWFPPDDIDLAYFEIKRAGVNQTAWEDGETIDIVSITGIKTPKKLEKIVKSPLNGTYMVAAFDTSGNRGEVSTVQFLGRPPTILGVDTQIVDKGVEVKINAVPGDFPIAQYRVYSDTSERVLMGSSDTSSIFIPVIGVSNIGLVIEVESTRKEVVVKSDLTFDLVTGDDWKPALSSFMNIAPQTATLVNATEVSVVGNTMTFSALDNPVKTWEDLFSGNKTVEEVYEEGNLDFTSAGASSKIVIRQPWTSGTGRLEGLAVLDVDTSNLPAGVKIEAYINAYENSYIVSGNPAYIVYNRPTKFPMFPFDIENGIQWFGQFKKALMVEYVIEVKHTGEEPGSTFNIDVSVSDLRFSTTIRAGEILCDENDANGTLVHNDDIGIYFVNPSNNTVDISDPILTPKGIPGAYTEINTWDGAGFYVKLFDDQGNRTTGTVSWSIQGVFNSN